MGWFPGSIPVTCHLRAAQLLSGNRFVNVWGGGDLVPILFSSACTIFVMVFGCFTALESHLHNGRLLTLVSGFDPVEGTLATDPI